MTPRHRIAIALLAVALGSVPAVRAQSAPQDFHITAGPASLRLQDFISQSGVQLLYAADEVRGVATNAVAGSYTAMDALDHMLAGSGLVATETSGGAISIRRTSGPVPNAPKAEPKATGATDPTDGTVVLNPFEVQTDSDRSYGALNSNSLTAFNAALDHLPVSADIYDQAFMNDIAATSVENMIQSYSAGAGSAGLFAGSTAFENQPGDNTGGFMQLRGTMVPTIQRDSLLFVGTFGAPGGTSIGQTSTFDVERVEIIDGPQSMLYDGGGAGGVINVVSKEARIGQPDFGSFQFMVDQYGTKYGQFDFGASKGPFAIRVATINSTTDTRRVNVSDALEGGYVQLAGQAGRTTLRLSLEQTVDHRVGGTYEKLTATSGDPNFGLNGDQLEYLLATGQAGGLLNGRLNWGDINSYEGDWNYISTVAEYAELKAETQWTDWFSTQLSVGASNYLDDRGDTSNTLYSPTSSSNPLPGNWTESLSSSTPAADTVRPYRSKAARFSALCTNDLFGGAARSQTIAGIDYVGARGGIDVYDYYEADGNWNPILNPALTSTGGRTTIPKLSWSVNNGPVPYPYFNPPAPRVTIGGVNYVRELENPESAALVSPANPNGVTIPGGGNGLSNEDINEGVYSMNYTQWLDGRLDTLLGARLEKAYTQTANPVTIPAQVHSTNVSQLNSFNFSVGADYHLRPWLAPYFTVSDSYTLPPSLNSTALNQVLPAAHALGEEVGFKIHSADGGLSGSVALYHVSDTNEQFNTTGTLSTDINPTGLNGRYSPGAGNGYPANVESNGLQTTITATPTPDWRVRLSAALVDGSIASTYSEQQVYNDQFYENSAGQITYADGTVVYVPAAFNSKELTVPAGTAGAVPLTAALISNPSSSYYANPNLTNGAIASGSNAAKVLETVSPAHGPILTGVTGLPISQLQLVASEIPGLSIPGTVILAEQGDSTTGYPELAVNLTGVYTFPSGWERGAYLGGTALGTWKNFGYYYYPNGVTTSGAGRTLFSLPSESRFDLIAGYRRKIGRMVFETQLNVFNLFNHYRVVYFPDALTGWASIASLQANLSQQPRLYEWTNRISF